MNITFSLIVPTYNRAQFISETIQSVLNQTYPYFELIIVDDGSTDNTEEITKTFRDSRIRYYKKNNQERAIARNYGIEKATGNYVTFLDSDDQLYKNHFEEALSVIQKNNNPEWLHLGYEIKDEKGTILRQENKRKGNINKTLITGNHLSCIGVFIRNEVIQKHPFNVDPDIIGSEDHLLWLKLASLYPLYYSNTITAYMSQHSQRSVVNFNAEKLITRIEKSIDYVLNNVSLSKKQANKFKAHRYLYLSLHLLLINEKKISIKVLLNTIRNHYSSIFHIKTLIILKKLIFK